MNKNGWVCRGLQSTKRACFKRFANTYSWVSRIETTGELEKKKKPSGHLTYEGTTYESPPIASSNGRACGARNFSHQPFNQQHHVRENKSSVKNIAKWFFIPGISDVPQSFCSDPTVSHVCTPSPWCRLHRVINRYVSSCSIHYSCMNNGSSDSVHGIITWLCTLSLTPFTLFSRRIKRLAAEHKDYCSRRVRCLRSCTMFARSATFDFQNFSQIKLSCVVHRVKRKRTIPPLGPILWNSLAPVQRVPAWETWQVPSHQFPDQEVMGDPFFAYLGSPPVHLFNLCLPITGQTIPRPILYTVWSLSKQAGAHKGNFFSGRCSVYLEYKTSCRVTTGGVTLLDTTNRSTC